MKALHFVILVQCSALAHILYYLISCESYIPTWWLLFYLFFFFCWILSDCKSCQVSLIVQTDFQLCWKLDGLDSLSYLQIIDSLFQSFGSFFHWLENVTSRFTFFRPVRRELSTWIMKGVEFVCNYMSDIFLMGIYRIRFIFLSTATFSRCCNATGEYKMLFPNWWVIRFPSCDTKLNGDLETWIF